MRNKEYEQTAPQFDGALNRVVPSPKDQAVVSSRNNSKLPNSQRGGVKMNELRLELEHCFGIRKLKHVFDFSNESVYVIYAPNGSMKSSLATTFADLQQGRKSRDRMFADRINTRVVTDENGAELAKDNILVLQPYDRKFGTREETSTLLVNDILKAEFEQLHKEVNQLKESFIGALKDRSKSRKSIEAEISIAIRRKENLFYESLARVESEVNDGKEPAFAHIEYDSLFDDKVMDLFTETNFQKAIQEYISRYDELLSASTYFKKGVFEYYNASQIAKQLSKNGFFAANHRIILTASKNFEIATQEDLEKLISDELKGITEDKNLKKAFDKIKKQLEGNETVREFQKYLGSHPELIPFLSDIADLKDRIWVSYFKAEISGFNSLLAKYRAVEARTKQIYEEAEKETTQWDEAITLFRQRFIVPYEISPDNRVPLTLGRKENVSLSFKFREGKDVVEVGEEDLFQALSEGEKKAFYILNVIFEVEVRKKASQKTLIVIDDIADSFDYRNKFAIIQYLKDISEYPNVKLLILTHNFDFFRTCNSRFVPDACCLMASKSTSEIVLQEADYIRGVFVKRWKPRFFTDQRIQVASIPFMRNLIELTKGADQDYDKLTSLLHWKPDSATITIADLDQIYSRLFNTPGASGNQTGLVVDLIQSEGKKCTTAGVGVNFENKIVLAIAIRLSAEKFMVAQIANPAFVKTITRNQTPRLLGEFKRLFPKKTEETRILNDVMLTTPENIHLNSFMYEPILDMSDEHLRELYNQVLSLK